MKYLELLAPAKDYDTAVDTIDCGADAVYMGAAMFGARYAAGNTVEDIARVAKYAHRYGVRLYVTLNTLLYEEELSRAEVLAREVVAAGADALIVQDMAYCRMGLDVELHASTQTNCASVERVRFFEQVGFRRAVLERSLSCTEIEAIHRAAPNIELEAFVHGAICVSHSGRCFLSRSMSERSGNRGSCSQPCRLEYDLCDAEGRTVIAGKHLLSVRDLDLSAHLGEMIDAGVTSFKIEGRLKDRSYVRNVVSHYRQLLDAEIARRADYCRSSVGRSTIEFTPDPAKSFTRGASDYLFTGKRGGVASFDTPKAMGEYVGRVQWLSPRGFVLEGAHNLTSGDGICYMVDGKLVGTNVNGVADGLVMPNRLEGIVRGTEIYRNYNRLYTQAVERSRIRRSIYADLALHFEEGRITLSATDEDGVTAVVSVECATEEARDMVRGEEALRRQLSRSGDTMFEVRNIVICNLRFAPMSVVGALRREVLERLEQQRISSHCEGAPFVENRDAKYPDKHLTEQDNVTNSLARSFYADHGVVTIADGLDMRSSTAGCRVMVSDYCLRREIGECLLERPRLKGDLFLVRGVKRYRLCFDCKACRMSLVDD